jgi:hypothetical protein
MSTSEEQIDPLDEYYTIVPGYTNSDVIEINIMMNDDFFDALVQDDEYAKKVDVLIDVIRTRETERIQRVFDTILGKGTVIVILE